MRARISDGSDPLTVQPPIRSKRMIQPVRNWRLRSVRGSAKGRKSKAARAGRVVGGQLQVAAPEEPGDPAVRAPEVEDEDARVVLQGLDEQEIERETLPRAGRPEDQRVADVAVKQVVVKRRLPLGFEDGERGPVQVRAARLAGRRAVDRRQARRRARRHEHGSDLSLARLRRQSAEPRRELAVAFADGLRVVRREDAENVSVQAFGLRQVAVQGNGEREIAVGHPLRFPAPRAHRPSGPIPRRPRYRPSPTRCLPSLGRGPSSSTAWRSSGAARRVSFGAPRPDPTGAIRA